MSEQQQLQVWVRNDKGLVYGPLSPPSVELLIDNGIIGGRLQVSTNGENYVYPGRVPGLRMIFPKDTWGDVVVPGEQLDAEWSKVVLPAGLAAGSAAGTAGAAPAGPGVPGPPVMVPGGPVAGPGIRGPVGMRPGAPAGPRAPAVNRPTLAQARAAGTVGKSPTSNDLGPAVAAAQQQMQQAQAPAPAFKSGPSVMDFMATATGHGPAAPAAAPPRSSPSVAEFMNAPSPAAPVAAPAQVRSSPSVAKPAPVQVEGDLKMPASGTLGQPGAMQLYYIAASTELTGLLTLVLSDRELTVHFRKGNPEFLDSTHPEDSLDTFLIAQRLATQAQIDQAQAAAPKFGGDLLPALFGLGLLNPNAVFQHLGQRASSLLFRALTAEQGSFAFDLEELAASRAMPLGNKWGVYLEALRKLAAPDVRRRQMGALDFPVMKASGKVSISDVRLTPQETRAYNHFDGARSLNQLVIDFPAEADVMMRVAWMLSPLELVSFAGVVTKTVQSAPKPAPAAAARPPPTVTAPPSAQPASAAPRPPPVMTAAPAAPAAAPGNPVNVPRPQGGGYPGGPQQPAAPAAAPGNPVNVPKPQGGGYPGGPQQPAAAPRPPPVMAPAKPPPVMSTPSSPKISAPAPAATGDDVKHLQGLLESMKTQTYFDVLGLKKDADSNQVKIAYLKAARSYHPDTVPPGAPEALAKVKADLFALIGEANRTLSDAKLRADYVAELDAGGTGSKVDIEKLLRAEELFQKGRVLVQARKYPDAQKMFDEAIGCNPDEAEFYAWRGWARYLAASDRKAAIFECTKDLKLCLEKNPNVASVHYFLGVFAKAGGDEKAAIKHFKECVRLDPRHIDAARELRPK